MDWATGADQVTKGIEMDWAMEANRVPKEIEIDRATGSMYSGDPRVDSISSHLVSSHHTTDYTLYLCQLLISLALSVISWILAAGSYHNLTPSSYAPQAPTAFSHEFLLQCHEWCGGVLMMGDLLSGSAVSPHMEPKCGF